jgi:polar amino acid transport system substrate-binding protein
MPTLHNILALAAALLLAPGALPAADAPRKTVALATTEWAPYIGQEMPEFGYVHILATRAFALAGYDVEIRFYPWARALALAREGNVAGLLPEYYDAGRTGEFAYSDAFPGGPVGFYARRDRKLKLPPSLATKPAAALATLKHLRFGVVRGYLNAPAFDTAPGLSRDEARDDLTNLRKLYHGRVDAIVIDRHVAEHLLRTAVPEFAAELEYLEPPLARHSLYVAFSRGAKDHEELRRAFNRGLEELELSGELAAIRRRAGLGGPPPPS